MTELTLAALLSQVSQESSFYRHLFASVDVAAIALADLPVTDPQEYWEANAFDGGTVATDELLDGLVLRTGGSTGEPKVSMWSRDEWRGFADAFARMYARTGLLADGDQVANLFKSGSLYGGLLLTHDSLQSTEAPNCIELPIEMDTPMDEIVGILATLRPNVLMGFPSLIVAVLSHARTLGLPDLQFARVLVGGESMWPGQKAYIEQVTGARVVPSGYASTDAGMLGYADFDSAIDEYHVYDGQVILEIVDDQGGLIDDVGTVGLLLATSLSKTTMPIVRYPVGDVASWVDPAGTANRRFKLHGRTHPKKVTRDSPFEVNIVRRLIHALPDTESVTGLQLILNDQGPAVTIRIATETDDASIHDRLARDADERLRSWYPTFGPDDVTVDLVRSCDIDSSLTSAKALGLIDNRN